jgi:two-component system, NtrC family, response regulator AtoC
MRFKVLVIDDEPVLRESLEIALEASGYEVLSAKTGEEGLELFEKEDPDLVLLDHWLPGINGDEVLRILREKTPEIPVIIMTAQGSIELAVTLMKSGAFDFLVKPFDLEQMEILLKKGVERVRLRKEVERLRTQYREKFRSGGMIGVSRSMRDLLGMAEKLSQGADTTILIEGETGTGKELLAEYIHFLSPRSPFPFIPINCGAVPKDLFESELFGYEKGAFTGALEKGKMGKVEAADKGTLFLDEIGELSPAAQVKVLRILEEKEYFKVGGVEKKKADVRMVSATNKDLEAEVKKGTFRDDLYFRLNVVKLRIPPCGTVGRTSFPSSAFMSIDSTSSSRKDLFKSPVKRSSASFPTHGREIFESSGMPQRGSSFLKKEIRSSRNTSLFSPEERNTTTHIAPSSLPSLPGELSWMTWKGPISKKP